MVCRCGQCRRAYCLLVRNVDSHFLQYVLKKFCTSVPVTVLKALLMSIVAISVRYADFDAFRLSCMRCVSVARSVVVECRR